MFGDALADWSRYPDLEKQANATFELLVNTIVNEQQRGRLVAAEPVQLAGVVWSLSHGIAMLGIARRLGRGGLEARDLAIFAYRMLRGGLGASGRREQKIRRSRKTANRSAR